MLASDLKKKVKPVCDNCGSEAVRLEAWVEFNIKEQAWKITGLTDNIVCDACGRGCQPKWIVCKSEHQPTA